MAALGTWLDGEPADGGDQVRSFERALVMIVGAEYVCRALRVSGLPPGLWLATGTIVIAATLVLATAWRREALVALAATHAAVMAYEFPASGNHAYLELLFLGLLAFVNTADPEQRRLFLRAGRWIACVVLFASGIQKLALGYYLDGQFLAYQLGTATYRVVLDPLLPAGESARLAALDGQPGAGPYLVSSPLFLAVSRAVVLAEIALPVLLVVRRTRLVALATAVVLLFAIEAAAREVFFGLVMVNALLLFAPPTAHRAFVPGAAVLLTALVLVRLGLLPYVVFN